MIRAQGSPKAILREVPGSIPGSGQSFLFLLSSASRTTMICTRSSQGLVLPLCFIGGQRLRSRDFTTAQIATKTLRSRAPTEKKVDVRNTNDNNNKYTYKISPKRLLRLHIQEQSAAYTALSSLFFFCGLFGCSFGYSFGCIQRRQKKNILCKRLFYA